MKCFESCFKRRSLSRRHFTEETTRRLNQKVFNNEHLSSFDPQNLNIHKIWVIVMIQHLTRSISTVYSEYFYCSTNKVFIFCCSVCKPHHQLSSLRPRPYLRHSGYVSQAEPIRGQAAVSCEPEPRRWARPAEGCWVVPVPYHVLSAVWVRAEEDERPPSPSQCVYCSFVNESFRQTRSSECTTSQETTFISVGKIHPVVFSSSTDWNTRTSSAAVNK